MYVKKPIPLNAVQVTDELVAAHLIDGAPLPPGLRVANASYHREHREVHGFKLYCQTLENQQLEAHVGCWILGPGARGEYWPVQDDVFRETYEPCPPADELTLTRSEIRRLLRLPEALQLVIDGHHVNEAEADAIGEPELQDIVRSSELRRVVLEAARDKLLLARGDRPGDMLIVDGYVRPDAQHGPVLFYGPEHYVLSNFSSFQLEIEGRRFQTSEHAYHWLKFCDTAPAVAEFVAWAPSAHDAFKIAEAARDQRRKDWDDVKVQIMRMILQKKVMQHEYVLRKLLQTGNRELVEDSWRDPYWGIGPNRDGQNMLGKLWMEIRAELRANVPLRAQETH